MVDPATSVESDMIISEDDFEWQEPTESVA